MTLALFLTAETRRVGAPAHAPGGLLPSRAVWYPAHRAGLPRAVVSLTLNPRATTTRDDAGAFPSAAPPSAATRRDGASARAPGGSRPNGPEAMPPGPSHPR